MRYIESIACSGELSQRLWGGRRKFVFKAGVNILTGPNGSGKSTLLRALIPQLKINDLNFAKTIYLAKLRKRIIGTNGIAIRWFDFESDNPRLASPGMMDLRDLKMWGWGRRLQQRSHGEATREVFESLLNTKNTNKSIILLDEPEQALDFANLQALREILLKKGRGRWAAQFIIATHAPLLVLEPAFNIIEMQKDYISFMRKTLGALLQIEQGKLGDEPIRIRYR